MKIAGYAHGSSDPQDLDLQVDAIEQTATREGWQLVAMYTDMASAAEDARAGWNQLLADASWHTFEAVVVQRVDRVARSLGELRDILDQLRSCRVAFLALDEGLRTSTQDLSFREIARRPRSTPGTVYRRFYERNPSDAPAPRGEVGGAPRSR